MSAQENMENILRSLHILLSKSEPYAKEPSKVIIDKNQILDLLTELNKSVYDIMDEYELTKQSRDRAEREFQKKGDKIIWNASRKAEDVYAASVMYTDEALNRVQDIMRDAESAIADIYKELNTKLKEEERLIKKNQLELKASLQELLDTEKYLNIIADRNKELEREKNTTIHLEETETNIYANRQTEIKINRDYFEKAGIPMEDLEEDQEEESVPEVDIKIDLDADYFHWLEGKDADKKNIISKEKSERFSSVLKSFTSGKNKK